MTESKGLRTGISTGTCAAAAARAAAMLLLGRDPGPAVQVELPDSQEILVSIAEKHCRMGEAVAMVRKDAGDDPDVTHGLLVGARVGFSENGVRLSAGRGVGRATRPGLAVRPGEPAINPVPRKMILANVARVTSQGLDIEIIVPEGEKIAARTFNQRLGIEGGISILGTSGRVRPFSVDALKKTIALNIDSVLASGCSRLVLVPGGLGLRAAVRAGYSGLEVVEAANHWGFALNQCLLKKVPDVVLLGHPGKLLKFVRGFFNTHSSSSGSAVPVFQEGFRSCLSRDPGPLNTVEEGISRLSPSERSKLGHYLACRVKKAVADRAGLTPCRVILVDLKGEIFGSC